jgi:hypothetical protein
MNYVNIIEQINLKSIPYLSPGDSFTEVVLIDVKSMMNIFLIPQQLKISISSSGQIKMHSSDLTISTAWVKRLSYLYLLIPFLVFCLGFIRLYYALPITLILLWLVVKNWKNGIKEDQGFSLSRRSLIFTILAVSLWVGLSGIGGFSFQNTDFHTRNAIFRDLINYDWPVKYYTNPSDPMIAYGLTYYIGFWLPAALVGKLVGWHPANIALYLWTVTGILLALLILFSSKKSRPIYFVLLLVFFSGMDGLGVLLKELASPGNVSPALWPPILHLEWWSGFQYSSFTTQLFWVFNQSVPTWLCMALLWAVNDRRSMLFIWSLCAFFAPLPAIGMFPYVVLKIPQTLVNAENTRDNSSNNDRGSIIARSWQDIRSLLTFENLLGGGIVLLTTFVYFSANSRSAVEPTPSFSGPRWFFYALFVILEGLLLWSVFRKSNKTNLNWYLAGMLILLIPLIRIGSAQDFCMRASIPTLFMLMVWSAEMLGTPKSQARIVLIIMLSIGAITPLYEINRSVYRTADHFINPPTQAERLIGQQMKIYVTGTNEYDHPYTLTADSFKSLANYDPDLITNFLAKTNGSFFYKYLAK